MLVHNRAEFMPESVTAFQTFIALIFASLVLGVELSVKLWMIYAAGVLSLAIGLCYTLFEKEMLNLLEEDDYHD